MKLKLIIFILSALVLLAPFVFAENMTIDFFYSETCPHCKAEKAFLEEFQINHPDLKINFHLVFSGNATSDNLFKEMAAKFNSTAASVPRTFIADKMFIGFTESSGPCEQQGEGYLGYQNQIEDALHEILGNEGGHCDAKTEKISLLKIAGFAIILPLLIFGILFLIFRKNISKKYWISSLIGLIVICLFIFTKIIPTEQVIGAIKEYPLPLFTFIIGLLDGFNPCAMFVLSFLLALLVYTGSRKKMTIIGLTFIITSGFMYFLYMLVLLGILNTPIFESNKFLLRIIIGAIAVAAGAINLKDFFAFKKGISLTIPEKYKPKIFSRMREIVNSLREMDGKKAAFLAITATVVLAAVVNIIELACTLFLPLIYSSILTSNIESFGGQIIYVAFYNIVYIIPLLAIFAIFIYSLKSQRLTEKQGRVLKLIGGLLMLTLGLILLFRPELLLFA